MNIIKRYMDDPTSVNFEDAAQAASVVLDLKNNAEMGYGKADNKIAFQTAMSQGDRATLLERFLEEPAPARSVPATGPPTEGGGGALPTASQAESTRAHVNRLVGDRYSTMAPDQLARMSDEQRRAVEEQQRRQQEGQ
jgi:hypothetical protein